MSFALEGRAWLGAAPLFGPLSLSLAPGWTCLLGSSGSGKTTILRLLAGLPTAARFEGRRSAPPRIAFMAQSDLLQPGLSVLDNVLIGQHLRGQPPDRCAALDLLAGMGLAHLAGARPQALSGGQRQRVALARALMEEAPLALLDEPFSALDAVTRRRMQDLARQHLAGRSVLLVTHDPLEALRLGDRLLLLADGALQEMPALEGPPPHELSTPGFAARHEALLQHLEKSA